MHSSLSDPSHAMVSRPLWHLGSFPLVYYRKNSCTCFLYMSSFRYNHWEEITSKYWLDGLALEYYGRLLKGETVTGACSICQAAQTPWRRNKSHLHVLFQLDLDRVVLFTVPDSLLVELFLVVLHLLDAVHQIFQLKAEGDKGKDMPHPCSNSEGSLSALRNPVPQGFELEGHGLHCLPGSWLCRL